MAHECPECGITCYCNGDIDDYVFNIAAHVSACEHWRECSPDEDKVFEDSCLNILRTATNNTKAKEGARPNDKKARGGL